MEKMSARILEIEDNRLLVLDLRTGQEVAVNTDCTCGFAVGDRIVILFNGAMTLSIPPQIGAIRISRVSGGRCR